MTTIITEMYSEDDSEKEKKPEKPISVHQGGKWISIKADGKKISIPAPEYVTGIERRCQKLESELELANDRIRSLTQQLTVKMDQANQRIRDLENKLKR